MELQTFLRRPILAVAEHDRVETLVRRTGGSLVNRFVAGETLGSALAQVKRLYGLGLTVTLDQLGENVHTPSEAEAAVTSYTSILTELHDGGFEPNISVKLTMLGLDFGEDVAEANMLPILTRARDVNGFVRIDMEGSAYTGPTIAITERLHERFPGLVGTVVQSYLLRSASDVERLIERNIRVRLVKGAYAEPASVAFQNRRDVDASFRRLTLRLLDVGTYPAIATHDPALIQLAHDHAAREGLDPKGFEFQLLYGVRRDEQVNLRRGGYQVRVYVPFGTEWYPYFTRRIAERPANALFVLRQMVSR